MPWNELIFLRGFDDAIGNRDHPGFTRGLHEQEIFAVIFYRA